MTDLKKIPHFLNVDSDPNFIKESDVSPDDFEDILGTNCKACFGEYKDGDHITFTRLYGTKEIIWWHWQRKCLGNQMHRGE